MQKEIDLKRTRFHRSTLATFLVVVLGLALVSRVDVAPLAVSVGVAKKPPPLLSPTTYRELLSLDSSRLVGCDIALMNLLCAEGLPECEEVDVHSALALLEEWASRVKSETQRHFYRFQKNQAKFEHSQGYFRMLMMAVVLHEDFQVRYNPERIAMLGQAAMGDGFFADSQDVFLHGLLGPRRMGTCSSMLVLYVALGRRLGYPLKLVTTKGHLFVRWESSTERFNVDATSQGMNRYDDEHYRNWPFPLTDAEIKENGYLKSLSSSEEFAVFLSIRAQCLMEAGRNAEALASMEHAVRLRPAVRDQELLLVQARMRSEGSANSQPSVPNTTAGSVWQIPAAWNASYAIDSDLVPDPNPLRQIR